MKKAKERNTFQLLVSIISLIIFMLFMSNYLYALPATKVSKITIKSMIVNYINENMPWPKGTVRTEFCSQISDIDLTAKDITYRVVSIRGEDFIGYSNFAIRFYDQEVFLKEKTFRLRLEVLRDMVVSTGYLAKGTNISKDDVKLVKKWFDRISSKVIMDINDVLGKRLRTSIKQPDTIITRNMLMEPVMVKRGKLVRIVLEKGPLKVTTIGLSEQNGAFGDIIKVKNISSKNVIYARVMGDSLVQVEF
ncbi:MAG: flagellar basal body P-ring formation protein FlgA [Deltaproteobacteria bacterium]|nr:flagellar basal body P-ring formation protein FlgA [Deltaproteobacteria bacterium]MBW1718218.1 flagellar basal body P-ring formation protein FlgA [Deltaproteobacteria bacterium]